MALPNRIELCSGADRPLRLGLWLVWMAALLSVLLHAQRMPLVLLLICAAILLWSRPGNLTAGMRQGRLALHSNGLAHWGDEPGEWHSNTWRSRWYTAIRFRSAHHSILLWISARENHPDDYRQLGIWCHLPPQKPVSGLNDSH